MKTNPDLRLTPAARLVGLEANWAKVRGNIKGEHRLINKALSSGTDSRKEPCANAPGHRESLNISAPLLLCVRQRVDHNLVSAPNCLVHLSF